MYAFPTDEYNADDAVLLTVPKADIPFFRRLWETLQDRSTWNDRESWFRGYQEAAWLEEMLMTNTLADLVEGQKRLYRLLDTALNGISYTATPGEAGAITIAPDIPAVPPFSITYPEAMRAQLRRLHQLTENAHTGAAYSAGEAMDATVELDYEGSWTARLMGLSAQLSRIISSIDGGGVVPPADNVLTALRGADEASATRNVIDAQGTTTLADLVDQVEALLTEIRDKLV